MIRVLPMVAAASLLLFETSAAEPNAFPYDEFAKFTEKIPGEKVDGKVLIAAFLKARESAPKIDPAKANFRILLPDGTSVPLKCEPLPAKPEEAKNPTDQKWIQKGFTHKLWIPKDPAAYAGSALLNDLPAESLEVQFPLPPREGE